MTREAYPTEEAAVVTCGLPYANGRLHIGHMRTFVGGDIFARGLRKLGQQTAFVCGSDMHGTPVVVNAEQEGTEPEEFALRHHEKYKQTFPEFNVEFDHYGHTREQTNIELTTEIVNALIEGGHIIEKEIQVAWDPEKDQPLPDRYIEGTCPYCGAKARGDECDEGCQRHLEPGEIENPTSVITGNPAEFRSRRHKFFRLEDFQEYLQKFIDRLEGTSNAINQPKEWIEGELQDWCITRDLDWGIDYPGEEAEDLVLYVWVDAPVEYISSTKQYTMDVGQEVFDWEDPWKDDGEIIHVIGQDIIQHHTVFWPAMLRGADFNEPRAVMAAGFVNLDGKGFSTSRNRAVWVDEYLEEGFHPDLYRYYVATGSSFQQEIDFSWDRFQERINAELVGTIGNFVYRSLLFADRNYDGTPSTSVSKKVEKRIREAIEEFESAINDYSLRRLGKVATDLAMYGNEYIQQHEPWKTIDEHPSEAKQVIRDCVQLVKAVAVLLEPIAPGKTEELWSQLGEEPSIHEIELTKALESPPGTFDKEPTELFTKIADERVDELNAKLEARIESTEESTEAEGEATETSTAEQSQYEELVDKRISFETFQDLDLRVGEIVSVEEIEGADELVKLEVDIGIETRQIVAGIRQLHDLQTLPGKRVIVVANLKKTELFGVESNGMILAAGDEADLLTTHGESEPGTRVK
ncbi:MAG: methionine--tRNA ligase [Halobacteriaceae archaeon]